MRRTRPAPARRSRRRSAGLQPRTLLIAFALIATALLSFATTQAFTATNTVPATNISQFTKAIAVVDLEPSECKGTITATAIVAGAGALTATAVNQLVLGSSGVDTLSDGNKGLVCMVGGAGADSFTGKNGGGSLCIVSAATLPANIVKCTVVATRP
jgi:Ca2+-binding RTX toxin-like protein